MGECQNNYIEWKKTENDEHIIYDSTYIKIIEFQTNLQWQKTDQ